MEDNCDVWDHYPPETIASGPYLFKDFCPAYLRVVYDALSNSATVTLLAWANDEGWWPISSLVWCPNEETFIENTSDDEWPRNPLQMSFSRKPEYHHSFRSDSFGVLEHMFAYARQSETLKDLAKLTDARRAELCEDDFDELADQLEKIGTLNLYPLDGTDYEYRRGTGRWEPLGSWHEHLENEFNK